jgi:hypothetical protein
LKNAREPDRQSAFASSGEDCGAGVGIDSGRHFGSLVGSSVGVICGSRPTSDKRVNRPHPLSSHPHSSRHGSFRTARQRFKTFMPQGVRFGV